ncbi:MAG: 3-phosphoshikimate 1-carboxyvinyltransferase [Dialister sp.]|nr:3-phosphoshikimate 1-carboxyvinyltransferase [Dialister sp.]
MNIKITPSFLQGKIEIPSSKSEAHRLCIGAALAEGTSYIENITLSNDIETTMHILSAWGATFSCIEKKNNGKYIYKIQGGLSTKKEVVEVDCMESGSTLRFCIPLGLFLNKEMKYDRQGHLAQRPIYPYVDCLKKAIFLEEEKTLLVKGSIVPSVYTLPGNSSSQFFTGLFMVCPLLDGNSIINIIPPLESSSYLAVTKQCLSLFGISISKENTYTYKIEGNQTYKNGKFRISGDDSQAAFWIAAASLYGDISIQGLSKNSLQGDAVFQKFISQMNGKLYWNQEELCIKETLLTAYNFDVSDCPDLFPVLAVVCALSKGKSIIKGVSRVRLKECDRVHAMTVELSKIGAKIKENAEEVIIEGVSSFSGGVVSSWNDHRIAMALAVASCRCKKELLIEQAECVNKSYPLFWKDFQKLGGYIKKV